MQRKPPPSSPPKKGISFPERLREKIEDAESPEICWQEGGDGIIVTDVSKVETHWKSFTRTMWAWGFRKGVSPQTRKRNHNSYLNRKAGTDFWYHEDHLFTREDIRNNLRLQHTMRDKRDKRKRSGAVEAETPVSDHSHTYEKRTAEESKGDILPQGCQKNADNTTRTDAVSTDSYAPSDQHPSLSLSTGIDHAWATENDPEFQRCLQTMALDFEATASPTANKNSCSKGIFPNSISSETSCEAHIYLAQQSASTASHPYFELHICASPPQGKKRQRTCANEKNRSSTLGTNVGRGSRLTGTIDSYVCSASLVEHASPMLFAPSTVMESSEVVVLSSGQALDEGTHARAANDLWTVVKSFLQEHCSLVHESCHQSHSKHLHSTWPNNLTGMTCAVEDLDYLLRISRFGSSRPARAAPSEDGRVDCTFDVHAFVWHEFEKNVPLPATNSDCLEEQKYWLKKKLQDLLLSHIAEEGAIVAAIEALAIQLQGLQGISTRRRHRRRQQQQQEEQNYRKDRPKDPRREEINDVRMDTVQDHTEVAKVTEEHNEVSNSTNDNKRRTPWETSAFGKMDRLRSNLLQEMDDEHRKSAPMASSGSAGDGVGIATCSSSHPKKGLSRKLSNTTLMGGGSGTATTDGDKGKNGCGRERTASLDACKTLWDVAAGRGQKAKEKNTSKEMNLDFEGGSIRADDFVYVSKATQPSEGEINNMREASSGLQRSCEKFQDSILDSILGGSWGRPHESATCSGATSHASWASSSRVRLHGSSGKDAERASSQSDSEPNKTLKTSESKKIKRPTSFGMSMTNGYDDDVNSPSNKGHPHHEDFLASSMGHLQENHPRVGSNDRRNFVQGGRPLDGSGSARRDLLRKPSLVDRRHTVPSNDGHNSNSRRHGGEKGSMSFDLGKLKALVQGLSSEKATASWQRHVS